MDRDVLWLIVRGITLHLRSIELFRTIGAFCGKFLCFDEGKNLDVVRIKIKVSGIVPEEVPLCHGTMVFPVRVFLESPSPVSDSGPECSVGRWWKNKSIGSVHHPMLSPNSSISSDGKAKGLEGLVQSLRNPPTHSASSSGVVADEPPSSGMVEEKETTNDSSRCQIVKSSSLLGQVGVGPSSFMALKGMGVPCADVDNSFEGNNDNMFLNFEKGPVCVENLVCELLGFEQLIRFSSVFPTSVPFNYICWQNLKQWPDGNEVIFGMLRFGHAEPFDACLGSQQGVFIDNSEREGPTLVEEHETTSLAVDENVESYQLLLKVVSEVAKLIGMELNGSVDAGIAAALSTGSEFCKRRFKQPQSTKTSRELRRLGLDPKAPCPSPLSSRRVRYAPNSAFAL
ncbi:hypothetical protein LINGRAHAP2_LOCUS31546 [Linum grandiflorum]